MVHHLFHTYKIWEVVLNIRIENGEDINSWELDELEEAVTDFVAMQNKNKPKIAEENTMVTNEETKAPDATLNANYVWY